MIRRPPRSTLSSSSAASDVYKRQAPEDDETVKNLIAQLRSLQPQNVASYIEGLNLSPQSRRDVTAELAREGLVPSEDYSAQVLASKSRLVSPSTGTKLIREVLTAPIHLEQKSAVIRDLPIDPELKLEVMAEIDREIAAQQKS
eukprot:TRINITY_DN10692_c0_g1_i1.p2 TRINITY_DN10692_c0_g1~~TRINITY_DN10692_c0_g1_i1.p2  ORF type:complete len:144 (+),score=36.66 TRINITY_DN10692_c0_g1_i1:81-512(+)